MKAIYTERLNFTCSKILIKKLKDMAKVDGETVSSLIRKLIANEFERRHNASYGKV